MYTSAEFAQPAEDCRIVLSLGRTGPCWDVAESFLQRAGGGHAFGPDRKAHSPQRHPPLDPPLMPIRSGRDQPALTSQRMHAHKSSKTFCLRYIEASTGVVVG